MPVRHFCLFYMCPPLTANHPPCLVVWVCGKLEQPNSGKTASGPDLLAVEVWVIPTDKKKTAFSLRPVVELGWGLTHLAFLVLSNFELRLELFHLLE